LGRNPADKHRHLIAHKSAPRQPQWLTTVMECDNFEL
jgi:hypothetical protein